jgi:hypothetical protein
LAVEYLEVARLSDAMRQEMLGGERSVGQLAEVLGLKPTDKTLEETLWELSRRNVLTVHTASDAAETPIALNKPAAAYK